MAIVELISREQNTARIRVALDPTEVDTAFKAVYRQLAKQMKVPGFRPGKVPPNIIRQRIGVETVSSEVDERLRQFAVNHALQELTLTPRGSQPRFEGDPEPAEGQPCTYEFTITVLPEVKLPDYSSWTIEVPRVALDAALKQRYEQRIIDRFTETTAKDGPAETGDLLSIGIHSKFEDGTEAPFGGHDIGFVLGRSGNLPGLDEQLAGSQAGETKDIEYSMPSDFADQRVAGKALSLHVHIDKVETITAPELNEEFIKDKLGMESRAQFDEYMDESLKREIETQLEQTKKETAMDRLVSELETDISDDMLKDEVDGIVQENDRTLRRQGTSLDAYLKDKGQGLGEYRDTLAEAANRRIRFFLAAKQIADTQGFETSQEDFGRYAYYLMQREGISPEQMGELMKRPEFFNEASYQIVLEKVLAHLAEAVTFKVHGEEPLASAQPVAEEQEVAGGGLEPPT